MQTVAPTYDIKTHQVVPHDRWVEARKELLAKEKEFTRLRDEISQARRDLPWEPVEKQYAFTGPEGKFTLEELFGDQSQLVIYHFMYAPDWDAGCTSCSFWADNFNLIAPHLRARDIAFAAISRAPIQTLEGYRKRMGWSFRWLSSAGTDFNYDYHVSFTPDEIKNHQGDYNYRTIDPGDETDLPGISVFIKSNGKIYHSYSTFGRGIDLLNGAYNYMDLTPKGRDEGGRSMFWLKRRDEYSR